MEVLKDEYCFVCGPKNPQGLQVQPEVDVETRSSCCRVVIPPYCQGWQGMAHGGIVATLLDEACIYACRSLAEGLVTAELTVRYRKPVPVNVEVEVRGQVTGRKRKILEARAELAVGGEVYAEAESRVFVVG